MTLHSSSLSLDWTGQQVAHDAAREVTATGQACPVCGQQTIRRSRRRGWLERYLMPVIRMRPYRCEHCDWRFYGPMGA